MAHLLTDQLRMMAEHHPDEVAFIEVGAGSELTFRCWEERSNELAHWFIDAGVRKGDRVALHLPPQEPEVFLTAYSAVHKAGAVAVPANTRSTPRELGHLLDHCGAVTVLSGRTTTPTAIEAARTLGNPPVLVTTGDTAPTGAQGPRVVHIEETTGGDTSMIQVPVSGDDMADLMYTSGTTGRPKAVVVRHDNIALLPNGLPHWSGDGWLHASPMFTFAGIAAVYNPMKLGMRLLYLPRFEADAWFDAMEELRPTTVFLVPAMAELLLANPRFMTADLSSVTLCSLGSAPLAPATLGALRERLPGATVMNAWGMTEAGPAYCVTPPEEMERRFGSVGRPVPPVEFRIVDANGAVVPAGTTGALLVRNPGREREYWGDPQATADAWRDGWLHTGDTGYLDDDGYLYLVGREKDVIIRGGNNVHAAEVEAVLYEHPGVQQAAVRGIPHDTLGEEIGAWVVPDAGTRPSAEDLRAFCEERLTGYKIPTCWTFLEDLPRNATGKVLKSQLTVRDPAGPGAGT